MKQWTVSLRTPQESGLPSVDVTIEARSDASVAQLAKALGKHVAPDLPNLHLVPTDSGSTVWPPDRKLSECGIRTGDLIDVVTAPSSWLSRVSGTAKSRAVLRVVEGPDRGRQVHARTASVTLGRGAACTLQLNDPLVSVQHARVVLLTRPTVYDEGSANGTTVSGRPLTGATEIDWGTAIQIGETTIVIDRGEVPIEDEAVSVFRPPRFGEPLAEGELEFPAPPSKTRPSPLPWTMLMLPMVMGAAMLMRTQSAFALTYMLAWPLVALLGWRQQKRAAEKQFREELAEWRTDVDALLTSLDDAEQRQRERFHDDFPADEVIHARAVGKDPYLWARTDARQQFLTTRVGIGSVPALLYGSVKDSGDRNERRIVAEEVAARALIGDMPVLVEFGEHRVISVTGDPDRVDALVRAMLLRLAFDHSPTDLSVAGCFGRQRAQHEAWLRWLPHATPRLGGEPAVATGPRAALSLLEHLVTEDSTRAHTVCLVDEHAGIPRRTVEAVSAAAAERNLHLVWMGRDPAEVPSATDFLVDIDSGRVGTSDRLGIAELAAPDGVSLDQAWRSARSMTGYVDEAAVLPASTAIPSMVRLPEVSSDFEDLDDVTAVLRRWSQSTGLRAQIGIGVDGVSTLDLREDGPHGLVAGTTGSGKSELLQSLICSLALNNPPSRISFLLVDYKGGAAFRECADLPHTVGYITDLTPALVTRALTSLSAEIAAREELLAEYGVKDVPQLEREHPGAAPPSLLICVDEFAALTAEVPDFVDGMVNLAQRGRSLGMHVLLATQRPAGVVTGPIRANTDLRIALRVSSTDDSRDVIDSPEAARISRKTPGRAWIRRTGHGTAELVQSAWTGARQPLDEAAEAVRVEAFTAGPRARSASTARLDPRTDLVRCVTTICAAHSQSGAANPPQPWLPPLPAELLLNAGDTAKKAAGWRSGQVRLGRIDEPLRQAQPDLMMDLAAVGHLLVYGASGSGKTELLRVAALEASVGDAFSIDGVAPHIYGLDFAGGGLSPIRELPTVTAIVPEAQTGRVLRLIRLMRRTMDERAATLAARGCSDLADLAGVGVVLPRVYLMIDNLPSLLDSLESGGGVAREHVEFLQSVLQNGRRVGIHLIATAPGRSGIPTAVGSAFGRRIVLRMTTVDDYLMMGVPGNVLDADSVPGSGLLNKAMIQITTTGGAGTPVQAEKIAHIAQMLKPHVQGRGSALVPAMPARIQPTQLPAARGSRVPIGVDADAVAVIEVDLRGITLIAGRDPAERAAVLAGIAQGAERSDSPPHLIREADAVAAATAWHAWRTTDPAEGSWALMVVEDGVAWDSDAQTDPEVKESRDAIVAALTSGEPLAVVLGADCTSARQRTLTEGLVPTAKLTRRGALLQPEWNDGEVFGVTVPNKTTEPLTGAGRGLWCEGGEVRVAQMISQTDAGTH